MFWINLLLLAAAAFSLTLNTLFIVKCSELQACLTGAFSALLTALAYLTMRSRLVFKHSNEGASSLPKNFAIISIALIGAASLALGLLLEFRHMVSVQQLIVLATLAALTFLYFIPISLKKDGKRLRDIYWLKHFVVGANWSLATVAFPCGFNKTTAFISFFMQVFFLIAALSMSFDLRDAALDVEEKHRSFLLSVGETKLKQLSILLLLCCAVSLLFSETHVITTVIRISLLAFSAITIWNAKPNDASAKFNVVLESVILLYGLAVLPMLLA
ncbi:MAG: hypothetical protein KF872_03340 [Chitinophagales bacterium]|nr:hypothetical protein [Chitinophagales bacterium]